LGGLALSAGVSGTKALLAWVALNKGTPQLFLTLLDAGGRVLRQRMFTHTPGEVSDVAVINVGDGWIVAWVDERHGDPEVYTARVNRFLQTSGMHRVTRSTGAATGVTLTLVSGAALLVWADARSGNQRGWADLHGCRLSLADAKPLGSPRPIFEGESHAYSPSLASAGTGAQVAWIEARPDQQDTAPSLRLGRLGRDGRARAEALTVTLPRGVLTNVTLECDGSKCHVLATVDTEKNNSWLYGFSWNGNKLSKPVALARLGGPTGQGDAPTSLSEHVFVVERDSSGRGVGRHFRIVWSP